MHRHLHIAILIIILIGLLPTTKPVYAAAFVVNSLADTDDGACTTNANGCTLREAINAANSNGIPDTITFSVSGTIYIQNTGLPPLTEGNTTIDGGNGHTVVISGEQLRDAGDNPIPAHGLRIASNNNVIRGLVIIRFYRGTSVGGSGIYLYNNAQNNLIANNWIGHLNGLPEPNTGYGILVDGGASNNRIGTGDPADRNVISGNVIADISIGNATSTAFVSGNQILGNYIGTTVTGDAALPITPLSTNLGGIAIEQYARDTVISGNVIGGYLGSNAAGIVLFSNSTSAGSPSIPRTTRITGNWIGVTPSGTVIANRIGILVSGGAVYGAIDTVIGDPIDPVGGRNYISGNTNGGIVINDTQFTTGPTTIVGNWIGVALNAGGNPFPVGNGTINQVSGGEGVFVGRNSVNTVIGPGNVIAGARTNAIRIRSGNTVVRGNYLGTDPTGSQTTTTTINQPTVGYGTGDATVYIENGSNSQIGGPNPSDRNVIAAGNFAYTGSGAAVLIEPCATCTANSNIVEGNYLGVRADGNGILASSILAESEGLRLNGVSNTTVRNNLIGGVDRGINIRDNASNNLIVGNRIGVRASSSETPGSGTTTRKDGIQLNSGSNNRIENNLIAFTGQSNLSLVGAAHGITVKSSNNQLNGNRLVRNGQLGVGHGIFVANGVSGVLISRNTTQDNAGDGISLESGANGGLAAPTFNPITAGSPIVTGSTGCGANCVVEIFTTSASIADRDREGPVFLTSVTTTTGGSFSANITGCLGYITATVHNPTTGNSSPFSNALNVSATDACATPTATLTVTGGSSRVVSIGSTSTYTLTLSHTASVTRTYTLNLTSDRGWTSGPALVEVPPQGSTEILIGVLVPFTAVAGDTDTTTVTARSDQTLSNSVTLTTVAQAATITPAQPVVSPGYIIERSGNTITFTHTVTNTGQLIGNLSVIRPDGSSGLPVFSGTPPTGWSIVSATFGNTTLAAGATTTLTIVVNTPDSGTLIAGDYPFAFRVRAVSQQGTQIFTEQSDPATTDTVRVPVVRSFEFTALDPTTRQLTPASSVEFSYVITNTGNFTDTFIITPPTGTTPASSLTFAAAPASNFTLAAGQSRPITLTVTAGASEPVGLYNFTVQAGVTGGTNPPANRTATGTAQVIGGGTPVFVSTPIVTPSPVNPGATTTITVTVRNGGNAAAPFEFTQTLPTGWNLTGSSTTCPSPVPNNSSTCTYTLQVDVPATADGGDTLVEVRAIARNGGQTPPAPDSTANQPVTVTVATVRNLSFTPTSQTTNADPATTVSFTHTLTNTGNAPDRFTLSLSGLPSGWTATVDPPTTPFLARNASLTVTVQITVPTGIAAGTTATATVRATSQGNPTVYADVADSVTVNAVNGAVLSPGTTVNSTPGATVVLTHTLQNSGSTTTAYDLAAESADPGWSAPIIEPVTTPVLTPGSSALITVTVTVPTTAPPGTSNLITVTARATGDTTILASAEHTIQVGALRNVVIEPERNVIALPDMTTVITHTVRNIGFSADSYTITALQGDGLSAIATPNQIDLGPGESREIAVLLTLPAGLAADTVLSNLRVTAISRSDPSVKASVLDRVRVGLVTGVVLSSDRLRGIPSGINRLTFSGIELENLGNSLDTFDLTVSGLDSRFGVTVIPNEITLNGGQRDVGISVIVNLPPIQPAALRHDLVLTATSRRDPSQQSRIRLSMIYLYRADMFGEPIFIPLVSR
ncbi:MAG: CSLREA domain-containing protein [Chloroflexus sp.]|uniref:beta strand repeat-containing protein n=1 Tax=Chloroflexus sp. TaxID=1904827 RepID=UPI0021DD7686|nr:NEW3 domain-containing protein [Chloroflexus sp.]GIV87641.1 MAG: CSLREA domain-containing protein [Chloroflexus sp.]